MAEFRIPLEYRPGLAVLLAMDDHALDQLRQAIDSAQPRMTIDALADAITPRFTAVSPTEATQTLTTLASLYTLRAAQDLSIEQVVDGILNAIEQVDDNSLSFRDKSREQFAAQLTSLLEVPSLMLQTKAAELMTDHHRLFRDARIITDIRPVFGNDPHEPPTGFVLVHTLKIGCLRGFEREDIFVALDSDDLTTLKEAIERAEAKRESIAGILSLVNVPNLDAI